MSIIEISAIAVIGALVLAGLYGWGLAMWVALRGIFGVDEALFKTNHRVFIDSCMDGIYRAHSHPMQNHSKPLPPSMSKHGAITGEFTSKHQNI